MIQGTEGTDRNVGREPRSRWRYLILLLIAAAAALLAWPSASRWLRAERTVAAERLRFATVVRGDLERDLALNGRTVAAFHPTLSSPAQGIVHVVAQPGEMVADGQVLLRVESPELTSRLARERSALESLASEVERQRIAERYSATENAQQLERLAVEAEAAERAMKRAQQIFDQGLVNAIEYEKAQDQLKIARLDLEHARRKSGLDHERHGFELHQAELARERQRLLVEDLARQVDDLDVRAPVAGLVSRLDVADRDAVERGDPLAAVVDLSAFEIEVGIPQSYAAEVAAGTVAEVTFQGQTHEARVRRISPEVEDNLVKARLELTGTKPEKLRQGQMVNVRLVFEAHRDVLLVRRGPFLEASAGREAYVLGDDGVARRRAIEIGARGIAQVEVLSGLAEGEKIILSDTSSFAGAESVLVR